MSTSPKPELTELRVEEILVVHNVRKRFDEEGLQQLAQSILDRGIIEPLIVRFVLDEKGRAEYHLVAGERRLRAAKIAGLEKVPVIVRAFDPATAAKVQLIENLQRQDIDAIEEAEGFDRLVRAHGVQAKQIAQDLGVSEAHISNRRRLLRLPEAVRDLVSAQKLSARTPTYQVASGHGMEQTGMPMGTWAYFCEACRQGVWDTGLSLVNAGVGPLPGERVTEEQRAMLKQKAAERRARFGSVGMAEVEDNEESEDEPGGAEG